MHICKPKRALKDQERREAMKYKEIKLALFGLMALAIMPMVAGDTLADSDSGSGDSGARSAELFLGGCPGAPCADVELSLDGDGLKASADGFGFPLDDDETGMLNRYALCVDDIFIGDDQVKSTDRRVVEDDGVVDISGEVGLSFTTLVGRVPPEFVKYRKCGNSVGCAWMNRTRSIQIGGIPASPVTRCPTSVLRISAAIGTGCNTTVPPTRHIVVS